MHAMATWFEINDIRRKKINKLQSKLKLILCWLRAKHGHHNDVNVVLGEMQHRCCTICVNKVSLYVLRMMSAFR